MVKQDAVAGIKVIRLAVVHADPVGIQFGHAIGRAGVEGCGLCLRGFLHKAVQL